MNDKASPSKLTQDLACEDVTKLHDYAKKLLSDLNGPQATNSNTEPQAAEKSAHRTSLRLELIQTEWAAQQAEFQLASQGGAGLMSHPGYRKIDTSAYFVSPDLELADISESLLSTAQGHAAFLEKSIDGFEKDSAAVEKAISVCQEKIQSIEKLDANLALLRKKRRLAVAGGEDTEPFDKAIANVSAECEGKELLKQQTEDEIEGLKLRLDAIQKALSAARTGLDHTNQSIKVIQFCLIAVKYNEHAESAAELLRQLYDREESVSTIAEQFEPKLLQNGFPGLNHSATCFIPRVRLLWPQKKKSQAAEEVYFTSSYILASNHFKRKFNTCPG